MSDALSEQGLKAIRERCEAHASGDFVICALYRGEECSVGCRDAWALLSEIERLKERITDLHGAAEERNAGWQSMTTEIARLTKIEERAKDVAGLPAGTGEYSPTRLRSETAQYILEGDLHTQTTKGDT